MSHQYRDIERKEVVDMATIWCIPLPGHPIFLNECPRGTDFGNFHHIKWALLAEEAIEDTNTRLACACKRGDCARYVVDTEHLRAVAHRLRRSHASERITTLYASVEVNVSFLELRRPGSDVRPRTEASRAYEQQAVA